MVELLQQLVERDRIAANSAVATIKDVSTLKAAVTHDDLQHHVLEAGEAVPGKIRKEKVGVGVVGLVAR